MKKWRTYSLSSRYFRMRFRQAPKIFFLRISHLKKMSPNYRKAITINWHIFTSKKLLKAKIYQT